MRSGTGGRRAAAPVLFKLLAVLAVAAALLLTWRRIFYGMDLQDESFYMLVPWRWALGDKPFVNEQNIAQISGFVEYPFVKLFAVLCGNDSTGLVLYTRHVYLALMVGVATAVFVALRRILRWELSLAVATVFVTFIFLETPQLSYNTMAAAFLSLGAALALPVVLERRGWVWAFAAGVSFGLAAAVYPTLVFIMPFNAVFLAFAMGRRSVAMIAQLAVAPPPDPGGPPTGRQAWRAVSWLALGGVCVLVPMGLLIMSFGIHNVRRSWDYSMTIARNLDQLGGAAKAYEVAQGFWRFLWSRPYLVVAALILLMVYRRWPRAGRILLVALPPALWLAGQRTLVDAAGFVIVYVFLAPYLYLFIPQGRRTAGAKLLLWVWAPAMIAGAMTAFTSASGYINAPVGLLPGLIASGAFLAWSLEAAARPAPDEGSAGPGAPAGEQPPGQAEAAGLVGQQPPGRPPEAAGLVGQEVSARPARDQDLAGLGLSPLTRPRQPWVALIVLLAIVAVPVVFQFQFQERDVPYAALTKRCDFGPWMGVMVTPERYALLRRFDADLRAQARPGDKLLVFYQSCGYYLFWDGPIAANSYWLSGRDPMAPLDQATCSYYRGRRVVPTLIVHLLMTQGLSDAALQASCGGLDYLPSLVRPELAFHRKPPGESTAEILARLPRR